MISGRGAIKTLSRWTVRGGHVFTCEVDTCIQVHELSSRADEPTETIDEFAARRAGGKVFSGGGIAAANERGTGGHRNYHSLGV